MSRDRDLELALKLQAQFNEDVVHEIARKEGSSTQSLTDPPGFGSGHGGGSLVRSGLKEPMSIVDEQWELLDPNPDMRTMFLEFNDKYFWGRLAGVEVRWSPRMTLCAGLCCYEGHGGLCSIRLSSPLLKLRPRKDLVETLLHEMIHAYLFVTANNKDHDGHGPEFCKHMKRLNQSTGTNITIYHSFHDEVDVYRQHWWRCNGPCQKRPPYYGMVRRAMNRAPSPRDPWWEEHHRTCGGSYTKVKEPEGYGVKKGTKRKKGDAEEEEEGIQNETKKRATDVSLSYPGKGLAIGGTSTTSRLIQPKTATLDKFLKKVGLKAPPTSPSHLPSSSRSQGNDKEAAVGQEDRSRSSRLKALAAIFDSDDSDDEDIVIVKFDKPLKVSNSRHSDDDVHNTESRAGTSQSNHCPNKNTGNSNPRNSFPVGATSVSKPKQIENSDDLSRQKGDIASTSHSHREDHVKKQGSIIDAFGQMRQLSGDSGTRDEERRRNNGVTLGSQGYDRNKFGPSTGNASTSAETIIAASDTHGRPSDNEMVDCPVCRFKVEQSKINQHLDTCLS